MRQDIYRARRPSDYAIVAMTLVPRPQDQFLRVSKQCPTQALPQERP
jgi:hypothetical protein